MKLYITCVLLACIILNSKAQTDNRKKERADSLTLQLKADSTHIFRKTIAKPYLRVEDRSSFISKESINLLKN